MVKKVGKTTINQNKNQTKKKEKNLKSFFFKVLQSRSITSLHFFLSLSPFAKCQELSFSPYLLPIQSKISKIRHAIMQRRAKNNQELIKLINTNHVWIITSYPHVLFLSSPFPFPHYKYMKSNYAYPFTRVTSRPNKCCSGSTLYNIETVDQKMGGSLVKNSGWVMFAGNEY